MSLSEAVKAEHLAWVTYRDATAGGAECARLMALVVAWTHAADALAALRRTGAK